MGILTTCPERFLDALILLANSTQQYINHLVKIGGYRIVNEELPDTAKLAECPVNFVLTAICPKLT
jgi:hypothetical protein